jgi:hypothetical protein
MHHEPRLGKAEIFDEVDECPKNDIWLTWWKELWCPG